MTTTNSTAPQTIPLDRIRPWPGNPRKTFDDADLAQLAESIRTIGLLQPLLVRYVQRGPHTRSNQAGPGGLSKEPEPRWEIADGERRFRAAKLAGLTEVRCDVRDLDDTQMLEIALTSREQSRDLSPAERADGIARLVEAHGGDAQAAARVIGQSVSTVRDLLRLRQAPEVLQRALAAGLVSVSVAMRVCRVPGAAMRLDCARRVIVGDFHRQTDDPIDEDVEAALTCPDDWDQKPLSASETKELIQSRYCRELKTAPFSRKSLDLLPEAGSCDDCPKRAGNDPDLTADGARADTCTDTECYGRKCAAHTERLRAAAISSGQKILEGPEADKLWSYNGTTLQHGSPYVDLAAQCNQDARPKARSYKQLLEKKVNEGDVVVAIDQLGQAHKLVPRKIAAPILAAQGIKIDTGSVSNGRKLDEADKKEEARRREENKLRTATYRALLGEAAAAAESVFGGIVGWGPEATAMLRALAAHRIGTVWGTTLDDCCARRGWKGGNKTECVKAALAAIEQMRAAEALAVLVELNAGQELQTSSGPWHKLLGIDRAATEKRVKAELKAGKKPEPPAKANGKPKAEQTSAPAPITPETALIDLLQGDDVSKAGRALEDWKLGLPTVQDLLAAAGTCKPAESYVSHLYAFLRGIKGLGRPAAQEIGDALVDAGLIAHDGPTAAARHDPVHGHLCPNGPQLPMDPEPRPRIMTQGKGGELIAATCSNCGVKVPDDADMGPGSLCPACDRRARQKAAGSGKTRKASGMGDCAKRQQRAAPDDAALDAAL